MSATNNTTAITNTGSMKSAGSPGSAGSAGSVALLEIQSRTYATALLTPHTFRFSIAVIGIFCNSLVILAILKSKKLHTNFFRHAAFLALADLFFCAANALNSGHYVSAGNTQASLVTTDVDCMLQGGVAFILMGTTATQLANMALAGDRMLSILFPVWYMDLGKKYVLFLHGAGFFMCLVLGIAEIASVVGNPKAIPVCSIPLASKISSSKPFQNFTASLVAFSLVALVITVLTLIWRVRKKYKTGTGNTTTSTLEIKMIKVACLNAVVFACCWACGNFGIQVVQSLPGFTQIQMLQMGTYLGGMYISNSAITLIPYLIMLKKFREEVMKVLCGGKVIVIQVIPSGATGHNVGGTRSTGSSVIGKQNVHSLSTFSSKKMPQASSLSTD